MPGALSVTPLPPRVVAIQYGIFEAPDETGLSIAVPTSYALYTADNAPDPDVGSNGDWYIWVSNAAIKTYRKILNVWTLVSTISGGGGGGGDLSGVTITDSIFSSGDIDTSVLTSCTLVSPVITTPTVVGGTFTTVSLSIPTIVGGTITGSVITGLASPSAASDAATKAYVDALATGLSIHDPCRVATVGANVTLAGGAPSTLDGVSLALTNRIVVKDQSNPVQNGIYTVTTVGSGVNGTWTRATDGDSGHELDSAYCFVSAGTVNSSTSWVVNGQPLIGTDPVVWNQFFAIGSIPASSIVGTLVFGQIATVSAGSIVGTINAGQIGSVAANTITGLIQAAQIDEVNANAIVGIIDAGNIGAVNATAIVGPILAGQIGSVTASTIIGPIVGAQLTDRILDTLRLVASDISVVRRLAALPALPNTDYPLGSLVILTTTKVLYQNQASVWTVVTASSSISGMLTANDIASVNANIISGLIVATQISSVNASTLVGTITASQIGSVNASTIQGGITNSQITSVNASAITGGISASQITSVNASAITGSISSTQIGSVNATTITLGSLSAIAYTIGSGLNQTTINSSGLTVGNLTINGASSIQTIGISGTYTVSILGGAAGNIGITNSGINASMHVTGFPTFAGNGGNTRVRTTSSHSLILGTNSTDVLTIDNGGNISGASLNNVFNLTLNLSPDTANKCQIGCGEVGGSDPAFSTFFKVYANGQTRYVPFVTSV